MRFCARKVSQLAVLSVLAAMSAPRVAPAAEAVDVPGSSAMGQRAKAGPRNQEPAAPPPPASKAAPEAEIPASRSETHSPLSSGGGIRMIRYGLVSRVYGVR